jgi:hypothetical protein
VAAAAAGAETHDREKHCYTRKKFTVSGALTFRDHVLTGYESALIAISLAIAREIAIKGRSRAGEAYGTVSRV